MVDSHFLSHPSFLRHRHSYLQTALYTGLLQYLHKSASDQVPAPRLDLQDGARMHCSGENCQLVPSADGPVPEAETLEEACQDPDLSSDTYRDDDRLWTVISSVVKIVVCFLSMLVTTVVWTLIMLALLPFPYARVKQGNIYGHVTGRMLMWILGNPVKISGEQHANTNGIYICNHASPLDIFLVMWLTPTGTVGVAKKEVAKALVEKSLSLIVFPEGTRSATGRLLPFKKGFVHLAIQTRLPIVPMVFTGTHLAWQKNSLRVRPAPLTVTYLPPIKTDNWMIGQVEEYVEMVHSLYVKHLPSSQKPLGKV